MAGLEIVVRPFIFPDIRPRARQSLPPQDDPEKGFAKIDGQPAKAVTMSYSQSISSSHSRPVETQRRVDNVRVYQQEDDGTINRENFVDVQAANKIWMKEPMGADDDKPRIEGENYRKPPDVGESIRQHFYQRPEILPNMELLESDKIIKNPAVGGGGGEGGGGE